ncbi:EAL domain-containing protein [Rhodovulum sulfidophilum]|nr:EAL domain-containing protein [Rhodovulum sulfidophilum]
MVIQDIPTKHESLTADLLAQRTRMSVEMIETDTRIRPDHVYLNPPGTVMRIEKGVLRLTETGLMNCTGEATRNLADLADAGVQISIDDFGTGYSSLAYLQKLRPSELKIDRSFIAHLDARDGDGDGASERIVRAMLALAESLQLSTVAEGIETEEQLAWLVENGCEFGQGFLVSPGLEIAAFEALIGA